jgi:hypothetical protein
MKEEPVVWAFDLGKGSIGEAVRQGTNFLHKASLLIPAEFLEIKMGLTACAEPRREVIVPPFGEAAWLFPTIDAARLVLIREKSTKYL